MSTLVTFRLYDASGAAITGASPAFTHYLDSAGSPVSAPSIFEIGLGKYGFQLDTLAATRVFRVDGGASAKPRYFVGGNGNDVQAFGTYNSSGVPTNPGSGPTFAQYVDAANAAQSAPSFVHPAAGLYFFLPSGPDISAGRSYVVDTDGTDTVVPKFYDGTIGNTAAGGGGSPNPVTVSDLSPAVSTGLRSTQPVQFALNVTAPASLDRVIVWVEYPQLNGRTEVVHDGDIFTPDFSGSSTKVDTTATKRTFTVLRNGGWLSAPTIRVHANTDEGGQNS